MIEPTSLTPTELRAFNNGRNAAIAAKNNDQSAITFYRQDIAKLRATIKNADQLYNDGWKAESMNN